MESMKVDVLIAGAGPAGMTLATALQRQGVRFRIVDKDSGPTEATRAPVLWQRTQEILAALGLRDLWQPVSDEMRAESLHFYGKPVGEVPALAPNSPYPKAIYNGQYVTERILDQHLRDVGSTVEYGKEVVRYQEDASGAHVTCRLQDGNEEVIHADWVVSAEGSRSVVRHAIGLDFEGEKYVGYRIHVADVKARWTLATPVGQTFFMVEEHGYMGGQRLPGDPDRFYFYILTPDEDPEDQRDTVPLGLVQELVRKFSGDTEAMLFDPRSVITARYRHGLADTYRKGRAMLIGDAARSAPPLYGQGMNYAMHDAWNLAWKLTYVVKGWGPEALLDTFAAERRKLGAEMDARIDRTFRFITEPKPLQPAFVRAISPAVLLSDHIKHVFGQEFTEMDISYSGVGLNEGDTSIGKLKSGERAPALWVKHLPDCVLTNLLDLYNGHRWTLLVVTTPEGATAEELIEFAACKQVEFPDTLRPVLLSVGPKRPASLPFDTYVDAENRFARENDLPEGVLLLVRPDGYIAWVGKSVTSELNLYLDRWLR